MHWQPHYDELRQFAPNTQFRQGLPQAYFLEQLENCVIILDDLMDLAMKQPAILSIFTEGSHHRNVSVIFLSQNVFHQGKHSRTMSLNVQYMVLFKNARDQSQIQTLARQMFPTDWRQFLNHYKVETGKEFGHVILDLHPRTPDNQRIVVVPSKTRVPSTSAMEQFYRVSNPYSQSLQEAEHKMTTILHDKNMTLEEKARAHSEALRTLMLMRDNFEQHEHRKHVNPATVKRPPGILLPPENTQPIPSLSSDEEPDSKESLHLGGILEDGTDSKLLSHADTAEERKRKTDYIQRHVLQGKSTSDGGDVKRSKMDDGKSYNLRR